MFHYTESIRTYCRWQADSLTVGKAVTTVRLYPPCVAVTSPTGSKHKTRSNGRALCISSLAASERTVRTRSSQQDVGRPWTAVDETAERSATRIMEREVNEALQRRLELHV